MNIVAEIILCLSGYLIAIIVNTVWYRECEKMNDEWLNRCIEIDEYWRDICKTITKEKDDDIL